MNLSDFAGLFQDFFSWLQQMRQMKESVKVLEEEVDRLSKAMETMVHQAEHAKEIERLEREKVMMYVQHGNEKLRLQLQNLLLQNEHRLPPEN